jgi:SAM-dependent methyltransferase
MIYGDSIDKVILRHSTRGMDVLQKRYPIEHCKEAVYNFLKLPKGTVFLYTGFYVGGFAETDGPIGTYFLARALKSLSYDPIIVTDELCDGFFREIQTLSIPFEGYDERGYLDILDKHRPVAHVSIERCGKNSQGKYANMRGKDIGERTAPVDDLFALGDKSAPTFAVGDGGNEIGMGNFKDAIENELSLVPCVVGCDYPIIASVSNWGAYGFIAYLEEFYAKSVLPSFEEADEYLEYIVSLGSVDGVKSENVKSVDGKDWEIEKEILGDLKALVIGCNNNFTMAETYEEHSKSQQNIGLKLIEKFIPQLQDDKSLLDIGCGPGNLTYETRKRVKDKGISLFGMDIDAEAIKKAQSKYENIEFFVGSFFSERPVRKYDYIFSNEAIHWTPQVPEEFSSKDGIIYYFFNKEDKLKYREWGLSNLTKTFKFIDASLNDKAILQFGLDLQLYNVYDAINSTLFELFPRDVKKINFPLFYPTLEEARDIIAKHTTLKVELCEVESVSLSEETPESVLGFIKGFTHNALVGTLGEGGVEIFYERLLEKIRDEIKSVSEEQWKHCTLHLSK